MNQCCQHWLPTISPQRLETKLYQEEHCCPICYTPFWITFECVESRHGELNFVVRKVDHSDSFK